MKMRESSLNIGQRFRSHYGLVWEIDGFPNTTDKQQHVRLVAVWDPLAIKVISARALVDKSLFQFAGTRDDT